MPATVTYAVSKMHHRMMCSIASRLRLLGPTQATWQMTDDDIEGITIHYTPSGMKHIARRTDAIGQQDTMEVGMEQLEVGRLIEQSRLDASNIWTVADDVVVMQIPKGRGVRPIVHHTIALYFGQPYNHRHLAIASSKDDTRQLQ